MKYAVAENELHARRHIVSLVSDLRPDWQLAFEAETVQEIIDNIQRDGEPDIMLLDIELNDGNVFELFKRIDVRVPVVFTTAYDDYCLQAFKVNSLDYVMKPISMDALLFAIRKFETMGRGAVDPSRYADLSLPQQKTEKSARILISQRDSYGFVNSDDIAWFESEDKCQFLVTKSGERHITTFATLNEVEEILPPQQFFRLSRAWLVSIHAIEDVKKTFNYKLNVHLRAGDRTAKVGVSAARRKEFLAWFGHG